MPNISIEEIQIQINSNNKFLNEPINNYRYIRALSMIYLTFLLAATVVAYRVVIIGKIPEPGSTLIYTCSFFLANVYAEVYGPIYSKKLIWESIFCGYLFAILLSGINLLPAPEYWDNTGAYDQVLGHVLRFTNAGVIGYLLSAYLNLYLIVKWKHQMKGRYFWLRSLLASSLSEGAATFIAGLITFFGMLPTKSILILMCSALAFKLCYGFFIVWPASFLAYILKNNENYN